MWQWLKDLFCKKKNKQPPREIKPVEPISNSEWWRPELKNFQILHFNSTSDLLRKVHDSTEIVNLELSQIQEHPNCIQELHKIGVRVVAYMSASYEDWRDDASQYPEEAKGKKMDGWDELWPKLTSLKLRVFLEKRMKIAKQLGCDAIEIDNTDAAWNDTGFNISPNDNLKALVDLANRAHNLGLAIFLKNTGNIAKELEPHFDGIFSEQSIQYDEYDDFNAYFKNKKPVFIIEYKSKYCRKVEGAIVQKKDGYFKEEYTIC